MNDIEIEAATKTFGKVTAVEDLTLAVPKGSVYGFIGPNGSGKSTTLRMIMRILMPDSGVIRVLGEQGYSAANDRIGYLPEERGLYKKMSVRDVLAFHGELKGLANPRTAVMEWLERLNLADRAKDKLETLSKGNSQKVQFIATVLHHPQLVILDEPFSGLDPVNRDVVRDAVLDMHREGKTIIFSTHDMGLAEKMCDHLLMIYRGRKVLDGTLAQIQADHGTDMAELDIERFPDRTLEHLPGAKVTADYGNQVTLQLDKGADSQRLLAELLGRGRIRRFQLTRPSLHDIFVQIAKPLPEHETEAEQAAANGKKGG